MVIIRQMNDDYGMERLARMSVTLTTEILTEAMAEFMVCNCAIQC